MTRDEDSSLAVVVLLCALGYCASASANCESSTGELGVKQAGDDLGAGSAASAAGEEGQVPDAARPLAPPKTDESSGGIDVATVHLPRSASAPAVSYRVEMAPAFVDACRNEFPGLVVGGIGRGDLGGDVGQFDGPRERARLAEMSDQRQDKGDSRHGAAF